MNYTHQMERMRSKYHLDLEHPGILSLFMSREVECGAATLNLRRYVLKRWLKFRGIKVNDEVSQFLRRKSGRRTTQVISEDLLTREELTDILAHTTSPSVRAYLAVLYDTGSRPSSLTRVQMRDITEDRYGLTVRIRDDRTEHSQRSIRLLDPDTFHILFAEISPSTLLIVES